MDYLLRSSLRGCVSPQQCELLAPSRAMSPSHSVTEHSLSCDQHLAGLCCLWWSENRACCFLNGVSVESSLFYVD